MWATPPAQAQTGRTLDWVVQAGGTGVTSGAKVAVDSSGNSYVFGLFQGTTVFGAGESHQTTLTSAGLFVASYDSTGALRWVRQSSGTDAVGANGIAVDASGNVWLTGHFDQTATFNLGDASQTALTSAGTSDVFIARYDSAGALLWVKGIGGAGEDAGYDVAVDASGNSWVTGYFQGTVNFGLGEAHQTTLAGGSQSVFVARFDGSGALVWAKMAGGGAGAIGQGIAVDAAGNSYVTGYVLGGATFGAGEPNQTTVTGAGNDDIFLARYDSTGALVWVKSAGGTGRDVGAAIAIDPSGNSSITGYFQATASFGVGDPSQTDLVSAGGWDIFVARYDSSGALVWVKRAGGTLDDQPASILVDSSGQSYVTGYVQSPATFGPGEANETTLNTGNPFDSFVAQFDANGQLVSAKLVADGAAYAGAIATDSMGRLYLTGSFSGTTTFGAGGANETTLTSTGSSDLFLLRYGTVQGQLEVSFDSLTSLVSQYVTQRLVKTVLLGEIQLAKSLSDHGQITAMDYALRLFIYSVSQQTGRSLTPQQAATLTEIANALIR